MNKKSDQSVELADAFVLREQARFGAKYFGIVSILLFLSSIVALAYLGQDWFVTMLFFAVVSALSASLFDNFYWFIKTRIC